jgi:hypothetical protein
MGTLPTVWRGFWVGTAGPLSVGVSTVVLVVRLGRPGTAAAPESGSGSSDMG